jgi:hypothetical protein
VSGTSLVIDFSGGLKTESDVAAVLRPERRSRRLAVLRYSRFFLSRVGGTGKAQMLPGVDSMMVKWRIGWLANGYDNACLGVPGRNLRNEVTTYLLPHAYFER